MQLTISHAKISTMSTLSHQLNTRAVFPTLTSQSPYQTQQQLFTHLTHLQTEDLDRLLLSSRAKGSTPSITSRQLAQNVATLLGLHLKEILPVLGLSESTLTRQPVPGQQLLDQTYSITRIFALVANVLTPEGAQHWLTTPNPALEGQQPFALLSTRYGEEKVENLIGALLAGAVL